MNIMLPLLTDSLLQHPKVARTYYQLLLQLCETHTPQVAALPPSHFTPLMHSLDWGLAQADVQLISQCLGALGELATFHYHEARAGRPGLSAHSPPGAFFLCRLRLYTLVPLVFPKGNLVPLVRPPGPLGASFPCCAVYASAVGGASPLFCLSASACCDASALCGSIGACAGRVCFSPASSERCYASMQFPCVPCAVP